MKNLLGASVAIATFGFANLAPAADLGVPTRTPPVVAPAPVLFNWTGFYIGLNAGGSIGRHPTDETVDGLPSGTFVSSPAGFAGGGQIGYNWQIAPTWVFGLEGDFQGATQRDTADTINVVEATVDVTTQKLDWFATARARLGYTMGDWLWYVTGGGAWGRVKQDISEVEAGGFVDGSASTSHTKGGFAVGGGVETHLGGGWTAKAEYLFIDLGRISDSFIDLDNNTVTSSSKVQDHIFRAGINYKF